MNTTCKFLLLYLTPLPISCQTKEQQRNTDIQQQNQDDEAGDNHDPVGFIYICSKCQKMSR
jgi:hypothetical protein